jgi:hypothetical protein
MDKFCFSCGVPLAMPDFQGPAENYCKHCAPADDGKVMPREAVQAGIAEWFLSWQPRIDRETALQRADAYLKAMPYWAG